MSEPTVTIRVTTNATEASGQLSRASKELQAAAGQADTAPTVTAGVRHQSTPSPEPSDRQKSRPQKSQPQQVDTAPIARSMALAMATHFAGQGLSALAQGVGNMEGGTRTGQRISNIAGGALNGATAGAMIGGPVGAVIGSAVGTLIGAFQQLSAEAKEVREGLSNLKLGVQTRFDAHEAARQDNAFYTTLKLLDKPERLARIRARSSEIGTKGEDSIVNLYQKKQQLIKDGKTDTEEYKIVDHKLQLQLPRLERLENARHEELYQLPFTQLLDASKVTDSLGAMGGSIGPQVDVADVNRTQIELLRNIYSRLEIIARNSNAGTVSNFDSTLHNATGGVFQALP